MNATENVKIKKETKNKIRVDFDRTSAWTRFRLKYLSLRFLGTVIFKLFRLVLLLGVSYVILFPFISKIASSFMDPLDFVDSTVKLIPKNPTLNTYKQIIVENKYVEALINTTILSLLCGLIQTFVCCVIGYGFGKYKFRGHKILFALMLFTMIVPHQTLQLSLFMKFKYFDIFGILGLLGMDTIDLTNTYWPMAILSITGLAFKNGLYIYMMRQFFRGVPDSLEESAYIDGSGTFRTFIQIILPLSVPMMITVFLFAFSWQWTDTFYTGLFFTGRNSILLSKIITIPRTLDVTYAGGNLFSAAIRNTCGLLIIAPLIVIYLFCQRYLIQGIERSGITGE
ncbi:MAG: carbohydrate ABC transporter permease [Clostridia bacterium]|nr:carbohydrate ABC transporter permease [Clostridia bacterium]